MNALANIHPAKILFQNFHEWQAILMYKHICVGKYSGNDIQAFIYISVLCDYYICIYIYTIAHECAMHLDLVIYVHLITTW